MAERSWRFIPGTALGWWSVGLIALMPILFIIGTSFAASLYESVPAGSSFLTDLAARPLLALTMGAGIAAGISGFITGLLAILKHQDKSLWVILSTIIGGALVSYLVGILVFPA